jgi:acetyltransferase-like isoleucine patch superfamily enzyme
VSFNQMLVDQPQPEIARSAVILGEVRHPRTSGPGGSAHRLRSPRHHRGATIGDLCEIGNGAILMPGSRLGSGCILGEGTLVPADTVIPADSVLVGRPPHVIRSATDADRERLAVLRQHQTNLTGTALGA